MSQATFNSCIAAKKEQKRTDRVYKVLSAIMITLIVAIEPITDLIIFAVKSVFF